MLYLRGEIYWIALRHRGHRIRRSSGSRDKDVAQRQHDELAARLWQARRVGVQLSDALLIWLQERPRGASDLRALRQIRNEYSDRALIDVTEASLLETWGSKQPATYNRLITIIKAALNMSVKRGYLERSPTIGKRKPPQPKERWLTADEWKRLAESLPAHLLPMATIAITTGLRWGNVSGLTWKQVDMSRRLVTIEASAMKARKAHQVPLSVAAIAALRATGDSREGYVFTWGGKPIGSPKTGWKHACARAGLEGFRWHDLRHTWASWHVQAGTPLAVLQQLGGWASLSQVQRYAHLAPSHLAQFAGNAKPPKQHNSRTQ